jgi:tetratricopeptide (TPR) repeat protein
MPAVAEKVWVSRVLDYVAGAQVLCRTDLPYSLALATIILQDSLEIAIRSWLRYERRTSRENVEKYDFSSLLTALKSNHSLSPNVFANLKCLQDKRNALTHDIRGASISPREFATIQNSVLSALAVLIETPIAIDLLLPPIMSSPFEAQREGAAPAALGQLRDAWRSFYSGKTPYAQRSAIALVSEDPKNASAHHLIGLCLKRQDKLKEAFAALENARDCPGGLDDIVLMLDLADVALSIGAVECAEASSLRALEIGATGSERSRAYSILGDCNISTHDFSLAERYFREALTHDNSNQRQVRGLLKALQSQHKFDEAIKVASDAIKTADKNGYYYLDRALALWKRSHADDRKAAVKDLKKADDCFNGRNPTARLYFSWFLVDEFLDLQARGNIPLARKKLESAVAFLKQGIALSSPAFRPVVRNQLSLVYMYLGDAPSAVQETSQGLNEDSRKYVTNYLAHARALIFAERFNEAYGVALDSQSQAPMPGGRFWGKFFTALADILAGTNLLDWTKTRQELIDLSLRAKISSDTYHFGPLWLKIKNLNLDPAACSRLAELMRIANIS